MDMPTNWKIYISTFPSNIQGVFQVSGQNKLPLAMITVMIKIFYVWPSAIEGGVDKGTPMGEKCLDEKILKKLGRNKSCQFKNTHNFT